MAFSLEQWFDVNKPISEADADLTEVQMILCAVKEGIDPDSPDARRQYREMRKAVKRHNERFERK